MNYHDRVAERLSSRFEPTPLELEFAGHWAARGYSTPQIARAYGLGRVTIWRWLRRRAHRRHAIEDCARRWAAQGVVQHVSDVAED